MHNDSNAESSTVSFLHYFHIALSKHLSFTITCQTFEWPNTGLNVPNICILCKPKDFIFIEETNFLQCMNQLILQPTVKRKYCVRLRCNILLPKLQNIDW